MQPLKSLNCSPLTASGSVAQLGAFSVEQVPYLQSILAGILSTYVEE